MEEAQVIDLYQLEYSDLILLCSSSPLISSDDEIQRLELITKNVMQNLGPTGPGLLSITGVPKASRLRQTLLPLARKLALLNHDDRKRLLKQHNLGSDVSLKNLDRIVSSFAMQLNYEQSQEVNSGDGEEDFLESGRQGDCHDGGEFKQLGCVFKELGSLMMEIGVRLAQVCDRIIGGHELEESLLESHTTKGRLIHYHSCIDNDIIKESGQQKKKKAANRIGNVKQFDESKGCDDRSSQWQQWHYDYGIFTVLTAPMFLLANHSEMASAEDDPPSMPCAQECPSPSGQTYLQIFEPEKDHIFMVKTTSESYIVQVGEAADLLSKGKLRATLHCVCRPAKPENLSRETFVVFLQPAWNKTFSLADYPMQRLTSGSMQHGLRADNTDNNGNESVKFYDEIHKTVPLLASRLKDGMTFAEFSKETTKQYYGGSGLQSKRYCIS